jgi:hypothetical protein
MRREKFPAFDLGSEYKVCDIAKRRLGTVSSKTSYAGLLNTWNMKLLYVISVFAALAAAAPIENEESNTLVSLHTYCISQK